jgi:hypothetical protein
LCYSHTESDAEKEWGKEIFPESKTLSRTYRHALFLEREVTKNIDIL